MELVGKNKWEYSDIILHLMRTHKKKDYVLTTINCVEKKIVLNDFGSIFSYVILCSQEASRKIQQQAIALLKKIIGWNGNKDIEHLLPKIILTLQNPDRTNQTIDDLSSCIFVQNVENQTLEVLVPILRKGLREKHYEIVRKCLVIIDNLCKLCDEPKQLKPFFPDIEQLVHNISQNISSPEVRKVAIQAKKTLKDSFDKTFLNRTFTVSDVADMLSKHGIKIQDERDYIKIKNLCNCENFELEEWESADFETTEFEKICNLFRQESIPKSLFFEDTEEGEDLYKGEFSVAYGTVTLLKNTRLHLKKNRFYGLLGPNNCGKTTLMRAIDREQIEGFPKKNELKTIFVEHEIEEREIGEDETGYPIFNIDLSGVEWIIDYLKLNHQKVTREQVESTMLSIGFGSHKQKLERAADMDYPVTTYSGGWKMKMQLCAATLMNADILMLDEPTGHLDVTNIAWIKNWLKQFMIDGGSVITTSHDSNFLNEMCTHIIDFQKRKLVMWRGDLTSFVDVYPEKKCYFELKNDIVRFVFPQPGDLEGVKSQSKTILKMTNVAFRYPSRQKDTIQEVNLECSRISRIAVVGPNGAGKSTAIKVLIGQLKPTTGQIIKHPNLRLAYVAQHAFHHLEKHVNKTATQYIMWRFAGNNDKEAIEKIDDYGEEDALTIKKYFLKNGALQICETSQEEKLAIEPEELLDRRENKKEKTKEYETKWKNKNSDSNLWVSREILIKMGAIKLIHKQDEYQAAKSGLMNRQLTTRSIEEYLDNFGIDKEQASHTLIRSLSGGQKVKIVLAASLWFHPHLIILDEPTNYLDRDSLGALVEAIHEYNGGVIIISHNREFADAVCTEKWIMESGRIRKEGESIQKKDVNQENQVQNDNVVIDKFGNEIKVEKVIQYTPKTLKDEIKKLKKKIQEGKKKKTLSEDEIFDFEYKLMELYKIEL